MYIYIYLQKTKKKKKNGNKIDGPNSPVATSIPLYEFNFKYLHIYTFKMWD